MAQLLEYGRFSFWRSRRRMVLVVGGALLILGSGLAAWKWGSWISDGVRVQYYLRECMKFRGSKGTVVYDGDHNRMLKLAVRDRSYSKDDFGYHYFPASLDAGPISKLVGVNSGGIAFMHERTSRAGHVRLVVVGAPDDESIGFSQDVIIPPAWFGARKQPQFSDVAFAVVSELRTHGPLSTDDWIPSRPRSTTQQIYGEWDGRGGYTKALRIYLGEPDPQNASHFTIPYDVDGKPGIIDGWLGDDDVVRLRATGPWAAPLPQILDSNGRNIMDPEYPLKK